MFNKFGYHYYELSDGLKINFIEDDGSDIIYIPKEIDGKPVTEVHFDETRDYNNIRVLSISADLESFYLHSKTFSKLEKIVFEKDFDGTAEFVRDLVSLWAVKNIKMKATIPEVVFEGTPSKFVVKQHLLLSKDEKKLIVALTRESFAVPKSVDTICTKAILPTYKKTSIITYHPGVTTIENNPFGLDSCYSSMMEYAVVQMTMVPLTIKNIGYGLLVNKNDHYVGNSLNADGAHFVYEGTKLTIRTAAQNVSDEALQQIANLREVAEVVIENKDSPFEVKNWALNWVLIYKKDTLVRAIRKSTNKYPVYIPDGVTRSFIDAVKPENKTEEQLIEERNALITDKPEYVNPDADLFRIKPYSWRDPDIKVPLTNMFKLKNPVSLEKLEIKLKDLKIPSTRKKVPDYGFVIDDSCQYIKELVLPEGLTDFEIAKDLDGTSFALQKLVLPSTISVGNILPQLNQFKNLMLVQIRPRKMVQVKFGALHYIVANTKRWSFAALFYTYSYSGIDPMFESPFSYGSYGGITYVYEFEPEKLLHYENGYYYLHEDEEGQCYRLLKTDFVEAFVIPEEINGIKVKYLHPYCLSNVKNNPFENLTFKSKGQEYQGLKAYAEMNGLKIIDIYE